MDFTHRIDTQLGYDDAVAAVKQALQDQGFGILTEIDVRATMKAKLDIDVDPQVILGACSPSLAHRAITADPRMAALLPCNVVVRAEGPATVVEALAPRIMATMSDAAELEEIASDAAGRIEAALAAIPRA
jgi:uncharacterized protein (DUF302 family)